MLVVCALLLFVLFCFTFRFDCCWWFMLFSSLQVLIFGVFYLIAYATCFNFVLCVSYGFEWFCVEFGTCYIFVCFE